MLAGRMKLTNFIGLLILGLVGATLGLYIWGSSSSESGPAETQTSSEVPKPPEPVIPEPTPAAPPVVESTTPEEPAIAGSPDETFVLSQIGRDLGTKKIKDAKPGPWKVNLYQDAGNASTNRAKVDLDRDDNWDLKYTFEASGEVTRKRSSADDGNYDIQERWSGSSWEAL